MFILEAAISVALITSSTEAAKSVDFSVRAPHVASAPARPSYNEPKQAPARKSSITPKPKVLQVPITPPAVQQSPMPAPSGCNWAGC